MAVCEDIRLELTAYVRGNLDSEAAAAVAAHLQECPQCSAEAEKISATLRLLAADLPPADTPADLAANIFAKLHSSRNLSTRITADPRYRALSLSFGERMRAGIKRNSYIAAASLFLNAAAAVIVIALFLKLGNREEGPQVCLNPLPLQENEDRRFWQREILHSRENRPAIVLSGVRTDNGSVRVNIAQFADNTVLTLRHDDKIGCLRAFYPAAKESGVPCQVVKANLTIPAEFAHIFGKSLQMRIIEMENSLELWPQQRWQNLGAMACAGDFLSEYAPAMACARPAGQ